MYLFISATQRANHVMIIMGGGGGGGGHLIVAFI